MPWDSAVWCHGDAVICAAVQWHSGCRQCLGGVTQRSHGRAQGTAMGACSATRRRAAQRRGRRATLCAHRSGCSVMPQRGGLAGQCCAALCRGGAGPWRAVQLGPTKRRGCRVLGVVGQHKWEDPMQGGRRVKERPRCSVWPAAGVQEAPRLRAAESPTFPLNINLPWLLPS